MPIRTQSDLPAKEILENENIFVMDEFRAINQDIRPLMIWRQDEREHQEGNGLQSSQCPICIATVRMEEDEKIIWEKEKTEGRVLLFPAGFIARKWVKRYRAVAKEIELLGWIDNNPTIQDTYVYDMKVFPPEEILQKQDAYDKIFIISNLFIYCIYSPLNSEAKASCLR